MRAAMTVLIVCACLLTACLAPWADGGPRYCPPDDLCTLHQKRSLAKLEVIRRLFAGELTPPEAVEHFRAINGGKIDAEAARRQLITWVSNGLDPDDPAQVARAAWMKEELRDGIYPD
jgi:hypothetical protein